MIDWASFKQYELSVFAIYHSWLLWDLTQSTTGKSLTFSVFRNNDSFVSEYLKWETLFAILTTGADYLRCQPETIGLVKMLCSVEPLIAFWKACCVTDRDYLFLFLISDDLTSFNFDSTHFYTQLFFFQIQLGWNLNKK